MLKTIGAFVGGVFGLCALVFVLEYAGFLQTSFFAPKWEALRRDTMIQSRAYQEGTYRELSNLRIQYTQARTAEERDAIKATALHEATALDKSRLPIELQTWLNSL